MCGELRRLTVAVCRECLDSDGEECHEPGCSFFLHDVPTPDTVRALRAHEPGVVSGSMSQTGPSPILRYFDADHLPGDLREVSIQFQVVAQWVEHTLPASAERSTALRKLLEAKDAAVRAALPF